MKRLALIVAFLFLAGCTSRTAPVSVDIKQEIPAEQQAAEWNLSPLSESSIGQALLSCVREVNSVVITEVSSGEVAYESADDVLSQSFYDAVQIVAESCETIDSVVHDYEVTFHTTLEIEKTYRLWTRAHEAILVQCEDEIWFLPQTESDWIRSRLTGLA